jgi:hypothetical protein
MGFGTYLNNLIDGLYAGYLILILSVKQTPLDKLIYYAWLADQVG